MCENKKQPQLLDDGEYGKLFGLDIYLTPVFSISSIIIVVFVAGSLVFQEAATEVFKNTREWLTTNLDWFFLIAANLTLLFCLYVACSPLDKVRLGGADAKPEYSNATWFAFYLAWWFAWAPFVGTFIARISKGRTVREFIIFVLIPPLVLCLLWFGTFGGTALYQNIVGGYIALFKMFDQLPQTKLLSSVALLLTIVFFVTSSDSGSLILDTIAAGGNVDAPVAQRVFWCTIEGLVAIALLLGGGLDSLQAASLATGFPFALVLLGMAVCVWMGLRSERILRGTP